MENAFGDILVVITEPLAGKTFCSLEKNKRYKSLIISFLILRTVLDYLYKSTSVVQAKSIDSTFLDLPQPSPTQNSLFISSQSSPPAKRPLYKWNLGIYSPGHMVENVHSLYLLLMNTLSISSTSMLMFFKFGNVWTSTPSMLPWDF